LSRCNSSWFCHINPRSTSAGSPQADPWGSEARRCPASTSPTSAAHPRRSDLAADHLALPLRSIQALGEHQRVPLVLLALDVIDLSPCLGQNAARQRAPPCRSASAAARAAQSTPEPRFGPREITHDALITPDPEPGRFDPRSTVCSEVRRTPSCAAAGFGRRRCSAATPRAQLTRAVGSRANSHD
jgi:hypothetical protein